MTLLIPGNKTKNRALAALELHFVSNTGKSRQELKTTPI